MAIVNINITTYDSEGIKILGAPSSVTVYKGDTLRFVYSSATGPASTVSVFPFSSSIYTNTTNVSLYPVNDTEDRTLISSYAGTHDLTVAALSYTSRTIEVNVISSTDDTPDAFSFTDITNANPSEERFSSPITVSGINVGITASISGNSASFNVNNGSFSTANKTVVNGDTIRLKMVSSNLYNSTVSTTLSLNGVTDTWSITTRLDPGSGEIIDFPITSGTLKQSDIVNFYGGLTHNPTANPPTNLRAYLKGGQYVPNITKNSAIPTSGNLSIRDFLGSGTSLYFTSLGTSRGATADTTTGAKSLDLTWSVLGSNSYDPSVGFGNIVDSCEFRWTFTEDTGLDTGVTISSGAGTWSPTNFSATLSSSAASNEEKTFAGTLTLHVRSLYDTSKVITTNLGYYFSYFGQ